MKPKHLFSSVAIDPDQGFMLTLNATSSSVLPGHGPPGSVAAIGIHIFGTCGLQFARTQSSMIEESITEQ
jgi:hypothetical protein